MSALSVSSLSEGRVAEPVDQEIAAVVAEPVAKARSEPEALPVEEPEDVDAGYLSLYAQEWPAAGAAPRSQRSGEGSPPVPSEPAAPVVTPAFPVAAADNDDQAEAGAIPPENLPLPVAAVVMPVRRVEVQSPPAVQGVYAFPDINYLAEPPEREGPALTEDILEET
ncbi:MAG TPA: hypothetical protein VLJ78_00495, partial [Microvirga sp.]|nr:hypothetical protein [Microvirga sp.]